MLIILGRQHQHNFKNDVPIQLSLSLHFYLLIIKISLCLSKLQLADDRANRPSVGLCVCYAFAGLHLTVPLTGSVETRPDSSCDTVM